MELENRVQGMLERVFGPGEPWPGYSGVGFDSQETTVITYDESGVPAVPIFWKL